VIDLPVSRSTRWLPCCLRLLTVGVLLLTTPAEAADAPSSAPGAVLKGLIFVPSAATFVANGVAASADTVDLSRIALLDRPDFADRMRSLIGQQLTLATLNQIVPLATEVFKAAGRPAVDIAIPEQDVTSGVVQVVVTEFTAGNILVEGATYFPSGLYRAAIGLRPGQIVDMGRVQAGLKQVNTSDYRSAEVALRPGADPGTVDVVVNARDRLPITVSAGYNNTGAPSTGRNQWSLGIGAANTVGYLDDVLGYQYLTTDFANQAPAMIAHSATYALNLPSAGQFSMLGSYSISRPPVDNFVSSHGTSVQLSPRFSREIVSGGEFHVSLRGGYDFKSTNNNLAFGGTTIAQTAANTSQFELAALLGKSDKLGRTDGSLSIVVSPGGMIHGNDDASFRGLSAAARARYAYLRLDATRTTNLSSQLTLWTHAVGQVASNGLLPGEQLNAGGFATVRGYKASTVRGDAGLMLSNELRWAAGGVGALLGHDIGDRFQPFVFVDYAEVRARRADGQPTPDGTLTSFGPGVRVNVDRYLQLTLDAGAQVRVAGGRHYPAQFFDISIGVQY
jgi:hemolysin activation/secretion protein